MKALLDKHLVPILVTLLSVALILIYNDSFTSPFFQDDKTLLDLSVSQNWFQPIPNFPYRPISQPLFYLLSFKLFGNFVFGYHLVLFIVLATNNLLVYKIAKLLSKNSLVAVNTTLIYALNLSLFANYYWIATSYFSIGALLFFAAIYFYIGMGFKKKLLATLFLVLAVFSNEIALVLPLLFLMIDLWLRRPIKWIGFFTTLSFALFLLRINLSGFPTHADYKMVFNAEAISTLRWYVIRGLNLPEGLRGSAVWKMMLPLVIFIAWTVYGAIKFCLVDKESFFKATLFSFTWFVISAFPFFFLPNHMSSYYLTMAIFGSAFFVSYCLSHVKHYLIPMICYLAMTLIGLEFLRGSHWMILKNTGPIGQFKSL